MEKLNFTFTGNPENAPAMAHYMKNRFIFLGVKSPERRAQSKPLLQTSRQVDPATLHSWIVELYARQQREYQYLALDLAEYNVKKWQLADIIIFKQFITQKSWWDSVDHWCTIFGKYIQLHPEQTVAVFQLFFKSPNMWERRIAITLQLKARDAVETDLLTQAILFDQYTEEFFIQKAIGWALRQYSKFNPSWVMQFLNEYQLSNLAVREASKYL
ncbi:DNA alkylation repair protein [Loigolactobacillus zhaoyuanensis]|uniref:DNA alkylation repair protein n=1 Tax=Loigolactobacillus zhaoyuanensis TaxID=2486017 RepID=UPI000F746341|nr:DNA alkylation repair protein [Loigolactobacillus zhaoyuanensis]